MTIDIQLTSFLTFIILGIIFNIINEIYKKLNLNNVIYYSTYILLTLIFIYILYKINNGIIHIYFIFVFILGIFISKVSVKKVKKKIFKLKKTKLK